MEGLAWTAWAGFGYWLSNKIGWGWVMAFAVIGLLLYPRGTPTDDGGDDEE